jgi:flagellin
MSIINTNVMSLNSQRNLASNSSSLATTIQRLSSGLRINSAKDDAAGLAISERFTTQIRGINQAARNANDGISLAQTAEGALGEVSNNLQRIRELAVQSRNATNSASDREALDAEVQQLKSEIQRVSEQTSFNGTKLLDGSFTAQAFQIGANQGQTISVDSIANSGTGSLGSWTSASVSGTTVTSSGLAAGELTIDGVEIGAADASAKAIAAAINAKSSSTGVTATATNEVDLGAFTTIDGDATDTFSLSIGGVNIFTDEAIGADVTGAEMLTAINAQKDSLAAVGITFNEDAATVDDLVFTRADGSNVDVAFSVTEVGGGTVAVTGGFANAAAGSTTTFRGTVDLTSFNEDSFTIAGGTNAGLANGVATVTTNTGFEDESVLTVAGADKMIVAMDAALKAVNSSRADLGAVQNRFSSVIANLNTTSENLTASRSRIRDADYAKETAELSRTQILSQAGTAMLAQANQASQGVLSLLR